MRLFCNFQTSWLNKGSSKLVLKCVFLLWKSALVMCVASFFIILSEKVTDRKRLLSERRFSWKMVGIENCKCASELPEEKKRISHTHWTTFTAKVNTPNFHYFLDSLSLVKAIDLERKLLFTLTFLFLVQQKSRNTWVKFLTTMSINALWLIFITKAQHIKYPIFSTTRAPEMH